MLAKKYLSKIISIANPISGVYTIEFKSLGSNYKFYPGQFLHLAFDTDYDGSGQWPESRCFSMQSSPDDTTIRITYAVKGIFTKQMEQQLSVGSDVWLKLPYGDLFTQPHNKTNTVFIAGGTGITPFLSLFTHESFKQYQHPVIYVGFRSREHNTYEREFAQLTNMAKAAKIFYQDVDGILDIQHVFNENGLSSDYFISGPPVMIKSFKAYLIDKGVSAAKVLTDDWD